MKDKFEERLSERLGSIYEKYKSVKENNKELIDLVGNPRKEKKKRKVKKVQIKKEDTAEKNKKNQEKKGKEPLEAENYSHRSFLFNNKRRLGFSKVEKCNFIDYKYQFDKLYRKVYKMEKFDDILFYYENFNE